MTNLAARFNFSRRRSTEQTPAGMPPLTGGRRVRSGENKSRTWNISGPIAVPISSTMAVENEPLLPRHCAARPHDSEAPDRSGVDFDIAYFYGDATQPTSHGSIVSSPRSIHRTGPRTDCYDKQILVPLLAAQHRNSIRRRAEGFEMKEPDPTSTAPFRQKLISLQDAMARDDVRRRDEGFELASGVRFPRVPQTHSTWLTVSVPCSENQQVPVSVLENSPQSSSDPPTTPSVYSSESWAESLRVISATRSLHSVSAADLDFLSCHRTDASWAGSPGIHSNTTVGGTSFVYNAAPRALGR